MASSLLYFSPPPTGVDSPALFNRLRTRTSPLAPRYTPAFLYPFPLPSNFPLAFDTYLPAHSIVPAPSILPPTSPTRRPQPPIPQIPSQPFCLAGPSPNHTAAILADHNSTLHAEVFAALTDFLPAVPLSSTCPAPSAPPRSLHLLSLFLVTAMASLASGLALGRLLAGPLTPHRRWLSFTVFACILVTFIGCPLHARECAVDLASLALESLVTTLKHLVIAFMLSIPDRLRRLPSSPTPLPPAADPVSAVHAPEISTVLSSLGWFSYSSTLRV